MRDDEYRAAEIVASSDDMDDLRRRIAVALADERGRALRRPGSCPACGGYGDKHDLGVHLDRGEAVVVKYAEAGDPSEG